ncbi:hypothetical protein [Sphingomonas sp. MMS24-J13]|uniref:hypothetical protein n=1 Tax=Sphingomonas sp. MMS24-J13 TaxID=3238686 RepID=UPI00384BE725
MADSVNDNDSARVGAGLPEPDAHGQAAMLLVESLIHGLVARSILSVEDAVEVVDVAAEVKADIAAELGDSPATMEKSLTLLQAISASLRRDAPIEDGPIDNVGD